MATPRRTVTILSGEDLDIVLAQIQAGFAQISERLDGIEAAIANRQRIDYAKRVSTDVLAQVVSRPPGTKGRR